MGKKHNALQHHERRIFIAFIKVYASWTSSETTDFLFNMTANGYHAEVLVLSERAVSITDYDS